MQVISTHSNTDFDGLASVIAATILYPDAVAVLHKDINPNVKDFLSIHKEIFKVFFTKEINIDKIHSLIIVDTNNWSRLDKLSQLKNNKNLEIIHYDHHDRSNIDGEEICVEKIGATITLMIRELKKQNKKITPFQATLFLLGLYEDTGNLTFTSTTPEDIYAAAYLLENKADLNILVSFLHQAYGKKQKDVLFNMLETALKIKMEGFQICISKINIDSHIQGLAQVVSMFREIMNVDAVFGIFRDINRDKCIIIARSNIDELDVGAVMKNLGGGGHTGAGSALVKSVDPEVVENMIIELISGNQNPLVSLSDLISSPVFSIPSDTSMEKFAMLLRDKGCTGLPVLDEGKLVGIISIRDFRKIRKSSQMDSPVKAFMTTNIISIDPSNTPMEAARIMIKHDIGRLPVIKDDELIGIISRTDAMRYFYDILPD